MGFEEDRKQAGIDAAKRQLEKDVGGLIKQRGTGIWQLLILTFLLAIPFWVGYLFYSAPTCAPDEWPVYSGPHRICVRGHQ